jgi:hypothetical protein
MISLAVCEFGAQQCVAPGYRYAVEAVASRAVEERTQAGIQGPPNLAFIDALKRDAGPVRGILRSIRRGVLE